MARFEIETVVKDGAQAKGTLDNVSSSLGTLAARYQKLQNEIKKSVYTSRELEGQLKSLDSQFKAGTVSEKQYAAENKSIKTALDSARDATEKYNRQLVSLKATMNQNSSAQNQMGQSTKKLTGYHKDFQKGIRSSNSVAVEFSRILQDAPYGIQGVANNIQQLTQNFSYYARAAREAAAAQGKTLSTMALMKGAFSSLLAPANLLVIAVSAITVGWTLYSRRTKKAKKDTDEIVISYANLADAIKGVASALQPTKKAQDEFIKGLSAFDKATLKGEQNAVGLVRELKNLYDATQNQALSLGDRTAAAKELQKLYPSIFGNLKTESILAGNAATSYDKLAQSLVAVAKSKAYEEEITDNEKTRLANLKQISKIDEDIAKFREQQSKFSGYLEMGGTVSGKEEIRVGREIENLERNKAMLKTQNNNLDEENAKMQEEIVKNMSASLQVIQGKTKVAKATMKAVVDYAGQLQSILNKSGGTASSAGLTGMDAEVEKVRQRYVKLYDDISKVEQKAAKDTKINANTRNAILEQAANVRIRLVANEAQEQAQIEAKFAKQRLEEEKKLWQKINDVRQFADLGSGENTGDKFKQEYDKKIKAVEDAFAKLKQLAKDNPEALMLLGMQEGQIKNDLRIQEGRARINEQGKAEKKRQEQVEKELNRAMTRSVQRFGNEFFKIVTDIGQYSEDTFKGAIADIVGRLSSSFSGVFTSIIGTQLKDVIKTNLNNIQFAGLSKEISKAVVAGAGIAGSIISGATKPTSYLGQGLGGALSGAAAGTAIAPGIGTAIGAIVGGLAGIFGASAARKKEQELLEKHLEEQKKQTELMRQSALAFTSQIIGQMTNQGIVSGVERNEFGDIEIRLEGNNLVGSVSRTENAKKRGL